MTLACMSTLSSSFIVQSAHCYSEIDEQRDVFESHRHHIFSVAYYMTGDEREAEAILGSTFVQSFHQHSKPSIEMLDKSLMGELHSRLSLDPVPAAEAGSASLDGRNVRRTDLEEALWQLPARERLCFLLRDVEGYAPSRIAGLLETTDADVQRTVLSARLRIRLLLIEQRATAIA
jgi:DNA-directed RNA polymerase specialized sigma24 family protein